LAGNGRSVARRTTISDSSKTVLDGYEGVGLSPHKEFFCQ
jgi:hypothetical protein